MGQGEDLKKGTGSYDGTGDRRGGQEGGVFLTRNGWGFWGTLRTM